MLETWIIDHKFVLTSAAEIAEQVVDRFAVKHRVLGGISAPDCDGISDIWSNAKGSIENRSNSLLVHSSVKGLLISVDGMGLVAHFQWR